jgi:hypothetical protein
MYYGSLDNEKYSTLVILRCVIPVVFRNNKCMVCVYMSNTTMFIGSMLSIYYIKHNYMFRLLMLAIIRLYMNTYVGVSNSSQTGPID